MRQWATIGSAAVPGGGGELELLQGGDAFAIRVDGRELMHSSVHGSEDALADLALDALGPRAAPVVLVGGLGMGFTLAAALRRLSPEGRAIVAELVPEVVAWNRGPLAPLAGRPLDDPRTDVHEGDVGALIRAQARAFDAILLDVDNGPDGLSRPSNAAIYSRAGLVAARDALRPGGVLAVWSATPDPAFTSRLRRAGFEVDERTVRERGVKGGHRHVVWIARRRQSRS